MRTTLGWVTWRASFSSRLNRLLELPQLDSGVPAFDANQLQRDCCAERFIPGLIDRGHPAGSEQPDDGVAAAEMMPRLQDVSPPGAENRRHVPGAARQPGQLPVEPGRRRRGFVRWCEGGGVERVADGASVQLR